MGPRVERGGDEEREGGGEAGEVRHGEGPGVGVSVEDDPPERRWVSMGKSGRGHRDFIRTGDGPAWPARRPSRRATMDAGVRGPPHPARLAGPRAFDVMRPIRRSVAVRVLFAAALSRSARSTDRRCGARRFGHDPGTSPSSPSVPGTRGPGRRAIDHRTHRGMRGGSPHVTHISRPGFLSPDITTAILDGCQPIELSAERPAATADLPKIWSDQTRDPGFG